MYRTTGVAALAVFIGSAGSLAAQTVFTGTDQAGTANENLTEAIQEDFERDVTIGNEGRPLGFSGSLALRGTASTGNTDSTDIGLGANYTYFDGVNGYGLDLNYRFGSDEGTTTEESLIYDLEYTRDFSPRLFGFAKLQGSVDEFSSFETDTFVGFGAGYRIVNDFDTQWAIQAGPGYRVAELNDIGTTVLDTDLDEVALLIESKYSNRLSDTILLTNDTDIVTSDSDTVVLNDLGVSFSVAEQLALRTSMVTEYHSEPVPGLEDTDNTFGVSLVYDFN